MELEAEHHSAMERVAELQALLEGKDCLVAELRSNAAEGSEELLLRQAMLDGLEAKLRAAEVAAQSAVAMLEDPVGSLPKETGNPHIARLQAQLAVREAQIDWLRREALSAAISGSKVDVGGTPVDDSVMATKVAR